MMAGAAKEIMILTEISRMAETWRNIVMQGKAQESMGFQNGKVIMKIQGEELVSLFLIGTNQIVMWIEKNALTFPTEV